jgi:hypothetical protein
MEQLTQGVRDLHQRVSRLDELLQEHRGTANLQERLSAAAHDTAEATRRLVRRLLVLMAVGLLLWTPVVAYGAVWVHEKIRNNCYPGVMLVLNPPVEEPWYCTLFPGTDHPQH